MQIQIDFYANYNFSVYFLMHISTFYYKCEIKSYLKYVQVHYRNYC